MKVLTLSKKQLHEHACQLFSLIQNDGITIDTVVGIATGGIYVSQPIHKALIKVKWKGQYIETKLSRPSTETKESLGVKNILTKLPYSLLNILRIIEVKYFEIFKATQYDNTVEKRIHFSNTQINIIKKTQTLLLVDDAIDTGSTILALKHVIQNINPKIQIKVAVLTVTHQTPYIIPDYTLYRNVLLRCPWSMDYKSRDKIE